MQAPDTGFLPALRHDRNDGQEMPSPLLLHDVLPKPVEPLIFSVSPNREPVHHDDQSGSFYDHVIGKPIYNCRMWGFQTSELDDIIRIALASTEDGWVHGAGLLILCIQRRLLRYVNVARPAKNQMGVVRLRSVRER